MTKSFWDQIGLVFIAFIWGVTFVVVKHNIQDIEPFCFNCLRFSISAILVFPFMVIIGRRQQSRLSIVAFRDGCGLGFCLFSGFSLLTLGLASTTASNAGFITGMNVAMVPFFSAALKKQPPDRFTFLGITAASAGLYFLTLKGSVSFNKGDLLIFLGAVAFAFHVIFTETCLKRSSTGVLVMIQFSFAGVFSGICAYYMGDLSTIADKDIILSQELLTGLAMVVLLATCLALIVQTRAQKTVPPAKVALIFALEPVFAALAGHLWAGEVLGPSAMVGCALILIGMLTADFHQYLRAPQA